MIAGCPVVGFTGANGVGKTLVAVSECIADMRRGRALYSTVPVRFVERDGRVLESVPLVSLRQLLDLRDCTLLVDEVVTIFPSRGTQGMPDEVQVFLNTLRHHGVTVRWTAPAWMRADTMLRAVTQVVVNVFGIGKIARPGTFWPRPILVAAGAMDTTGVRQDAEPEKTLKRRVYIPQRLAGWGSYDSEADVPRIGRSPSGGKCVDCGGSVRSVPCTDDRHADLGIPSRFDELAERMALLAAESLMIPTTDEEPAVEAVTTN